MVTQSNREQQHPLIRFLEEIARLVRDFGMPTVVFGMGIYVLGLGVGAFAAVVGVGLDSAFVSIIGFLLILTGLGSWLWIYFREHPATPREEAPTNPIIARQLELMTGLVEECFKSSGSGTPRDIGQEPS